MNLVLLLSSLLLSNFRTNADSINEQEYGQQDYSQITEQNHQWEQYKFEFGKAYDTFYEDLRRKEIFMENSDIINEHNDLYAKGYYTFELGHNQFSDLTHQEYLEQYGDNQLAGDFEKPSIEGDDYHDEYINHDILESASNGNAEFVYVPPTQSNIPYSVDWRHSGAVTPVKNEVHCKASWAFSATGALEGQLFRRRKRLISLSEQNLVDCSGKSGNRGCKNGTASNAYRYIMKNGGIDSNSTYPWHGKKAFFCHYKKSGSITTVHGIKFLRSGNESHLAATVAAVGPISVALDARSRNFRFYKRGIYNDRSCTTHILNREMLVIGYTRSYWIIKNSWGIKWGFRGYIHLARNGRNTCGVATRALYPVI